MDALSLPRTPAEIEADARAHRARVDQILAAAKIAIPAVLRASIGEPVDFKTAAKEIERLLKK